MVLVHGYGGSGALFFKIIKKLCEYFCVVTMDLPGMGGSARPKDTKWKKMKPEDSNSYFVERFEKWRVAMCDNFYRNGSKKEFTDLYWCAHSFGGYVSGQYCLKYHQHIKKMFFLSPIGIKVR